MKKIIYFLTAMLFVLTACEKKLDLKPADEIDESKAFSSVEDIELGRIGIYAMMGENAFHGLASRAADDIIISSNNTGQGAQTHSWTYSQSGTNDAEACWEIYYHLIDRINRLLTTVEGFPQDNEIVIRTKGEALFLRAYGHFQLLRLFSGVYSASAMGVPIMLKSEIGTPARETMGAVCTQIETDLVNAKSLITDTESRIFASEYAVVALQARLALYKGEYTNAITYATDVIDNSGISLAIINEINDVWTDANSNNTEVILKWSRPSLNDGTLGDQWNRQGNDDIFFEPASAFIALFAADDVRLNSYFADQAGTTIVGKHLGRGGASPKNLVDIKALRISEMYLIRAEAYVENNQIALAASDIETIRAARIASAGSVSFSDQQDARNNVRLERRKELAYEGHRFYDLKRWGLAVERDPVESSLFPTLAAGDFHFIFPIPQQEMFVNSNMVQNPGY